MELEIAELIASSSVSEDTKNELITLLAQDSLSHLHIGCMLGNIDVVKKCMRDGADVNSRMTGSFNWRKKRFDPRNVRENSTPLHLAAAFGYKKVVEYLLEQNADIHAQDSLGFTPIHLAMSASSQGLARILFKATPNLPDIVSQVGLSYLHVAAWASDRKAVDKLLLNGAQVDRIIDADAKHIKFLNYYAGKTPLFLAHSNAIVKSLLEAGADMDAKDLKGVSALQHSLRHMSDEPIEQFVRMVKKGRGDVKSCGMTLLHVACGYSDMKWTKKLLRNGADVNARIYDEGNQLHGATPLHLVLDQYALCANSYEGLFEFAQLLIDNGADVSIRSGSNTVLHHLYETFLNDAVEEEAGSNTLSDVLRIAVLLLRNLESYDVNPVNFRGFSHFHLACLVNDVKSATAFLYHGVDINEPTESMDSCGFAPLHFAMLHRSVDVAYLLLKRGANVNVKDAFGNTPLHVAIKRKFVDLPLIEAMINRGADINAKNEDGETLLYVLWRYGGLTKERLEFFWNHGCFINILDTINAFSNSIYYEYDI